MIQKGIDMFAAGETVRILRGKNKGRKATILHEDNKHHLSSERRFCLELHSRSSIYDKFRVSMNESGFTWIPSEKGDSMLCTKVVEFKGKRVHILMPVVVRDYLEEEGTEIIDDEIHMMMTALFPEWMDFVNRNIKSAYDIEQFMTGYKTGNWEDK